METTSSSSSVPTTATDCNALGGLFQIIINDLRGGSNNWDDLLLKANKYHIQLKSTITASTAFLDSFQKIADMATTTRSGTKEIGSALTRLCLRHRSVEAKLKSLTSSLLDSFILPLQDRVEEWKKIISQLDKDHSKELKRLKQFKKKNVSDARYASGFANSTFRIKRNPRNKLKSDFSHIGSMYDMNKMIETLENKDKYFMFEEVERNFVRRALIEERSHYCLFFNLLRPVIEEEISMLQEITHLEEIVSALVDLTFDPYKLPPASESLLTKLQLKDTVSLDLNYSELILSNGTMYRSRKSSISSINSINSLSTDSISLQNCKSLSQPNITPEFRPKSIASQDSGFISHDYNVPTISRLTISNKAKEMNPSNSCGNSDVCVLNGKTIVCSSSQSKSNPNNPDDTSCTQSISSCQHCQQGEYASTEHLFSDTNRNRVRDNGNDIYKEPTKQPIYVNVAEPYCMSSSNFYNFNASDGSVTPTNQESGSCAYNTNDNILNNNQMSNYEYACATLKSTKPAPPKPPIRQCSTLTNPSNNQKNKSNSFKTSTRIYVVQGGNTVDFPPPPPEAYVNYSTTNANYDKVNNNKSLVHTNPNIRCCEYSIPNLVFCNDVNCLKGINNVDNRNTIAFPDQYCTNGHVENVRNSFAFESQSDLFLTNSTVYSSSNNIVSPSNLNSKSDSGQIATSSRKYHSTVNLHKPSKLVDN